MSKDFMDSLRRASYAMNCFAEPKITKLNCDSCGDEEYDSPIHVFERDNMLCYFYEAIGISKDNLEITEEFINKTKEFYVKVKGQYFDCIAEWDNDLNVRIKVDSNIYDRYDVTAENGIIRVILYEIINERPNITRMGSEI